MDGFGQIGKYLKKAQRNTELSLKREVVPQVSTERIRDIFDPTNPVVATISIPDTSYRVMADFNFGRKLPSLGCCADCYCGTTESYTSDSLVSGSIYVLGEYIPDSTVVYLDGIRATKGVEYTEANPVTGQLSIAVPFNQIIVSYVYTVDNCTELVCVDDRFECLGYTYYSGLTTVFSDRFDRSPGPPSGGCGYYFNTLNNAVIVYGGDGGEAIFGINNAAWLGGVNRVIGESVEVLAAVNMDNTTTATFTLTGIEDHTIPIFDVTHNTSFTFTKISSTVLRITLSGNINIFTDDPGNFTPVRFQQMFGFSFSNTTDIAYVGGRYWLRFAQMPDGSLAAKAWPQFTPEPASQASLSLADSYASIPIGTVGGSTEVNREMATGTIKYLRLQGGGFEAIMVGAGLDTSQYGINFTAIGPSNQSAEGYYCAADPHFGPGTRFGYNCSPDGLGLSQVTYGNVNLETQWIISYPTIFPPDVADPTLGRIVDYTQRILAIDARQGQPGGFRLTGKLAGVIWDSDTFVEIKKYPYGTNALTMGGVNGIQGGQTLGTYLVPKDGTAVDMNVFVPTSPLEDYVRVGIHVPNLDALATQQPFHFGGPTFDNNAHNSIEVQWLQADAVQSVQCTTGPFCDDCSNTRCPELVDNFDSFTSTAPFGTTDFIRVPTQGATYTNDKGTGAQVTYSGGVQTVSFQGSTQKFLNVDYASPFDCHNEQESGTIYDAYFEVKIGTPTGIETGNFSFGNINIDYTGGGGIFPGSFGITPTFNSTALTPGTWWSVRNRIEGTDFLVRIWPAGTTEPSTWTFEGTISTFPTQYTLGSSSSNGSSPTFTTQTRAVHITRGV